MEPKNQTYSLVEARSHLPELIGEVAYGKKRVLITKHNKPFAYLVSVEDAALLEALENAYDIEAAKNALKEAQANGFVEWETLRKELSC